MSVARELANYTLSLNFQDLPPDVVHHAKRFLLDTLGCAIGGYSSEASRILRETIRELDGPAEATVIGSGARTSCLYATLANGAMVRFLDLNDTAFLKSGDLYRTGYHPSEVIPAILALGERQHISGKEALAAIVVGYDLSARFIEAIVGPELEKRGWNGDTRGAYIMPLVAGKILGLSETQMENAVGISGSCHAVFGILDTAAEEGTMCKNLRFPMTAHGGILAALLALKGLTGPTRMIEGHDGFVDVIMKGDYDVTRLSDPARRFAVRDGCIKSIIADYSAHGHLTATLTLVKEHDLKPEDIAHVKVRTSLRCAQHTGSAAKKYPKNSETADHSSYYLTAIAIVDRQIGPDQFSPAKYSDPRVLDLIGKIELEGDQELEKARPAGIVEITTRQGAQYSCRVDYPRGHARNPMTDQELEIKFRGLAARHMNEAQADQVIRTVFELDRLEDVVNLCRLLVFSSQS